MSQQSFRELGVSAPVVDALAARSIHEPFPIQELALADALAGLDVLAKSPTGSGKTLAFALPIVQRTAAADARPSALVLVPTRELAAQVTAELESLAPSMGLSVASVYGGMPLRAQAKRAKSAHILVATPGRLQDLAERGLVDLTRIRIFVLDEADRMLDMGFQPQVDRIVRRLPRNRQTMFFSATLDGRVGELARAYTNSPSRFETQPSPEEPGEIDHHFVSVTNVTAVAMHGDMSQNARERALTRFESGKVKTLVATDVAARGLDLDDVTQVINFDPPEEDKDYVHRTGRTGRAGRDGTAVTLVLPEQQADTSRVARRLGHGERFEEAGMKSARPKVLYTSRNRRRSKW